MNWRKSTFPFSIFFLYLRNLIFRFVPSCLYSFSLWVLLLLLVSFQIKSFSFLFHMCFMYAVFRAFCLVICPRKNGSVCLHTIKLEALLEQYVTVKYPEFILKLLAKHHTQTLMCTFEHRHIHRWVSSTDVYRNLYFSCIMFDWVLPLDEVNNKIRELCWKNKYVCINILITPFAQPGGNTRSILNRV